MMGRERYLSAYGMHLEAPVGWFFLCVANKSLTADCKGHRFGWGSVRKEV
jgi:hypothetical protein